MFKIVIEFTCFTFVGSKYEKSPQYASFRIGFAGKIKYTKTSLLAYENECHQESLRVIVEKIIYYASRNN